MGRAIRFRDARRWPVGRRATAIVTLVSMAVIGYVGYVGYRSVDFTEAAVASADCRTPSDVYGWAFEPINYDPVEDARVRDSNPDRTRCSADRRGAAPGDAVVTADGVRLAGWYIPAAHGMGVTGPTLLVLHGWKSDKTGALDYAWPFHEDYNLVLFDLRNNGQSSGHQTSMGLYEQRDVERILDWLETTKRPAWVGGVGNSMGAATLLAVAEHDARLRALILDSMHADSVTSAENALENDFGIPGGPAAWALVQGVSLRVGSDVTSIDPISRVAGFGSRPVLFLQGTADQVDPPDEAADRNLRAALAAGVPAEVGYCPGARHGLVVRTCPELWAGRSLELLQRAQGRDVP
jgi:pimeloyl-ACP methyl ester carboxylesterase